MNHVILFFVDGLGIGEKNEFNPLACIPEIHPLDNFVGKPSQNLMEGILIETDARLGVDGRPQSATGQTAIYTGKNAALINGSHKHGYPNALLCEMIREHSIFNQLENLGVLDFVFLNAYPPQFFSMKKRPRSATTVLVETSSAEFRKLPDLIGRKGLAHDITNRAFLDYGFQVPEFTPEEAAEILIATSRMNSLTIFEYFLTDKVGHAMDWERAEIILRELSRMLQRTIEMLNVEDSTLILTSDHGNIENFSIRNHTLNKVPTIVWGKNNQVIATQIRNLTDITPAILRLLTL